MWATAPVDQHTSEVHATNTTYYTYQVLQHADIIPGTWCIPPYNTCLTPCRIEETHATAVVRVVLVCTKYDTVLVYSTPRFTRYIFSERSLFDTCTTLYLVLLLLYLASIIGLLFVVRVVCTDCCLGRVSLLSIKARSAHEHQPTNKNAGPLTGHSSTAVRVGVRFYLASHRSTAAVHGCISYTILV